MSDLFSHAGRHSTPAPTKIGAANAQFIAALVTMDRARIATIEPSDFPHANPAIVRANVRFHASVGFPPAVTGRGGADDARCSSPEG